jgi:hypothetical protein
MRSIFFFVFFSLSIVASAQNILKTPWTEQVNPSAPLPEYPRPQLVRDAWQNLNGRWSFAILPKGSSPESGFAGKISFGTSVRLT